MKIRIEMTAEELNKTNDLCAEMLPEYKDFIPSDKQQMEMCCNIANIDYTIDPESGFVCDYEMKTHFILWMIRKTKPFISAIKSLWHMFTDFFEDIELMAGDVTVLHNGVNLNEALSNITDELEYDFDAKADPEEDAEDPEEDVDEKPEQLGMDPIYTVHYNGKSAKEIEEHIRFFFDTEEQAEYFMTNDPAHMASNNGEDISNYKEIHVLYCHRSSTASKDIKNKLEDGKWFEYRGFTIQKNGDGYDVIKSGSIAYNGAVRINEALAYIDAKFDCKRKVFRVYSIKDKSVNRIFEKEDKARDYHIHTVKKHNTRICSFNVPVDFDFNQPTECTIEYWEYLMTVTDGGMTYVGDKKAQYITIFDAMDYIDECRAQK